MLSNYARIIKQKPIYYFLRYKPRVSIMYELEIITRITLAIARHQTPDHVMETGSRQFDAAWQTYLGILRQEFGLTPAAWDGAAGSFANATHTGMTPYSRIQGATRTIALCYLLCAQEYAATQADPAIARDTVINGPIKEQLDGLMDTVRRVAEYLDYSSVLNERGETTTHAMAEFYSVAMVALHELRRIAPTLLQHPMDIMLAHCDSQMSKYDLVSILPLNLEKEVQLHVNHVHQFHMGMSMGRESLERDDNPQQQQRQQRLQSRPTPSKPRSGFHRLAPQAAPDSEPAKLFDLEAERIKRAHVAEHLIKGKESDPSPK